MVPEEAETPGPRDTNRVTSSDDAGSEPPWLAHYEPEVPPQIEVPSAGLPALLDAVAAEHGGALALLFHTRRFTYAQLAEQVNRFAAALRDLGVERGDRVALLLPNCPQLVVALFGALKAGAVAVPLNPALVARELSSYLRHSESRVVVTLDTIAPRVRDALPEGGPRLVRTALQDYLSPLASLMLSMLERRPLPPAEPATQAGEGERAFLDLMRAGVPDQAPAPVEPSDLALLMYTGGRGGSARAAEITHANLTANTQQMCAWLWDSRPERRDVYLPALPVYQSYGLVAGLALPFSVAAAVVLRPRFIARELVQAALRSRATVLVSVPPIIRAITANPLAQRSDLRSIRVCISSAAPLPGETAQAFESMTGARVIEAYGLTEATSLTHCNPVHGERRAGSIGLPLPSTLAQVVDSESGEEVPTGEVGELAVNGPQVMRGYSDPGSESATALRGSRLFTGDMARQDEAGYFYIVDRKEDVILIEGAHLFPSEVEAVLTEHDRVQEAMVTAIPDRRRGEVVVAYVVLKDDVEATEQELLRFCAERLARYKVPARVEFREELPRTAIGKMLRKEVPE